MVSSWKEQPDILSDPATGCNVGPDPIFFSWGSTRNEDPIRPLYLSGAIASFNSGAVFVTSVFYFTVYGLVWCLVHHAIWKHSLQQAPSARAPNTSGPESCGGMDDSGGSLVGLTSSISQRKDSPFSKICG